MLKHVLPPLEKLRLRDATASDIQKVASSMLRKNYSVQTVKHVRTTVSAIFTHAKRLGWHTGDNPAKLVRLPEMVRRESHALSFAQSFSALASLESPAREMVLFAILTSMNIAEICGLQWKRVNLTEQFTTVDGESLPPLTIAVRAQWYRGEYGSVKANLRSGGGIFPSPWLSEASWRVCRSDRSSPGLTMRSSPRERASQWMSTTSLADI